MKFIRIKELKLLKKSSCSLGLNSLKYASSRCIFYRIDLATKLSKIRLTWRWNRPFLGKKSPHKFSDTDPSNLIINRLYTL